jgi:hypothetical protein
MSDNYFSGIENQGAEFEVSGGNMEPIPENTQLLAIIDESGWEEDKHNGGWMIELRWSVMQPETYKNRKVFQKLRMESPDAKKAEKAKRMLLAIDANAGGNIAKAGRKPNDTDLAVHLMNKPMVIKVLVWEMDGDDGEKRRGNWVCAVSPRKKQQAAPVAASAPIVETVIDDDLIPF